MLLKHYQERTLTLVREFLEQLAKWRATDKESRNHDPEWGFDWVQRAWRRSGIPRPYHSRRNGLGKNLPAFCLKIPTGGGKTLVAIRVIDLVNGIFRRSRRGLVLWIVPTTQIYNQTLQALKDKDHPYRQQLDLSSGQRIRILEKTHAFNPHEIIEYLCILVLMLPSANRKTKDTLRMFRDRGGFDEFFPSDDDYSGHAELLEEFPNLDTFEQVHGPWGRIVKTSLGNTVRLLRPLIILDEGHKAYSLNAKKTLEDFNPCMIVELSATPAKSANVLVEVTGQELNVEGMIKLDLHISNLAGAGWRDTLLASIEHRQLLEAEAERYETQSGVYIRPICVIQVERTGRQQRKPGYVHTDDVRECLLRHSEISQEHIATKTSTTDELKEFEETGGLMSRGCPIRFIITKQALQEGWDCPFAYVLTILTNPMSKTGITQLVGRILRQPYAHKTGVSWLDESYVFCFSRRGHQLLKEVRKGFALNGLQDIGQKVVTGRSKPQLQAPSREATRNLVLLAFLIRDTRNWRLAYREADILSRLPWDDVDIGPLRDLTLGEGSGRTVLMRGKLKETGRALEVGLRPGRARTMLVAPEDAGAGYGSDPVDYYFAASHLLDLVPNPWQGRELAERTFSALLEHYPLRQVAANYMFVLQSLRRQIEMERDRLSRKVFQALLESKSIRFLVVAMDFDFTRCPTKIKIPSVNPANRPDGARYARNLFDISPEDTANQIDDKVATYIDHQTPMFHWYSNRVRRNYHVHELKPRRVYNDFIARLRNEVLGSGRRFHNVFAVETKDVRLNALQTTEDMQSVLDVCSKHDREVDWVGFVAAMQRSMRHVRVVDTDRWQEHLNDFLSRGSE